jgi:hypothetical protein
MPKPQVRKLPNEENAFWETIHRWVITSFRTARVWFPSQWEEAPTQGFKNFLMDQFSSEMRSDEESLHAWSVAVRAIVHHLINHDARSISINILYDYPSCDTLPFFLLVKKGRLLGRIPIDSGDGIYDWQELRTFLHQIATDVSEIIDADN